MTDFRIVCVTTTEPHRHITDVGVGKVEHRAESQMTTAQVRAAIDAGDTFHTVGPQSGKRADVRKDNCNVGGCPVPTIRSHADAVTDNNLDNLRVCNWTS